VDLFLTCTVRGLI